jgi:PAS domain S-box-containing protein
MIMDERERYRELLAINRAVASAVDYEEVLRRVVDRTAAFTGATACALLLSQEDGFARVVRSVGIDPATVASLAVPLTERIDVELCSLLGFQARDRFVCVPVIGAEGLMGMLAVYWAEPRVWDDAHADELLSALADQAAIALDNIERLRRLRASEAKLAGIISIAADAIISVDEAQRIVMYNEGARTIFGWSDEEVLGKPLDILLPERIRESHWQHVQNFGANPETARKMGSRRATFFGLRKSGEEFPADASISKLRVGGGWLFTVALRDITEQKKIEHEEQLLGAVGDILATTLDAQKTLTNIALLAVREFADFCVVEFVGEQGELLLLEVMTSDPVKGALAEALKQYALDRHGPALSSTILAAKKPQMMADVSPDTIRAGAQSEEHRRLLEAIAPTSMMAVPLIVNDRVLGALVVASCRPERRYDAADLRLLAKVGQSAALALENARLHRATERAVQARDEVLGIVAHDLRNPLAGILAATGLALPQGVEGERRSPAAMIQRAAKRMDRLIQDLLDVTGMEAGRLSIERGRVPAAQVISDAEETQRAFVSSSRLDLRLDVEGDLPDVWADRDRLLQVLGNLIHNASKFTAPGGRITVEARRGERDVVFSVTDTGAGIPAADLPRLFDRFWQARKGERRGAGLGLAIARGIVEAHDGRIWVESTPDAGSTFYFTVPVAPSVEDRLSEAPLSAPGGSSPQPTR